MGVTDLLLELFTHAFCVLRPLQTAGAIAAGSFESFPNGGDDLFIRIQRDLHKNTFFSSSFVLGLFLSPFRSATLECVSSSYVKFFDSLIIIIVYIY